MLRWLARLIRRIDVFGLGVEFREPPPDAPESVSDSCGAVEFSGTADHAVRRDVRVAHLFSNARLRGAAEAALAYRLHGKKCRIKSWRTSSTWQQVWAVADERLCEGAG